MTAEQPNWNSRLAIKFNHSDLVSPINDLNCQFSNSIDIVDSIDACNIGYSYSNPRFKFDYTITAVNMAVFRKIFSTAVKGARFVLGVAYKSDNESKDWAFTSIDFTECVVTECQPLSIKNDNKAPTMKISAICLGFSATGANGETVTSSQNGTATGSMS